MSKIAQLREVRNSFAKQANELNAKYPADVRMPEDDARSLDDILAKVEAVDADIAREERANKLLAESVPVMDRAVEAATKEPTKHGEHSAALRAYFLGGLQNLSPEQLTAHNSRVTPDIRAAMSTTTTTEGGFTVAIEYMKAVERALKEFGGMNEVSTVINTASGSVMNFPTNDATAEVGAIIGQNTTVNRADTTFANVSVDVFKYTSNDIAIPFELLQDSFIDIETLVQTILGERLGRIWNLHATTGTGTGQPRGVVTAAASGVVGTTGSATSVSYDQLVQLQHSVDPAYRRLPGVGFMFNDSTLSFIRRIKDSQNRPLFVPGYEVGVPGGSPDTLLGTPVYINQDMPSLGANNKPILFGAFSKYVMRRVMDLTVFRMTDSAFTRAGQIGFVAFQRAGGNLVDVGGTTVKFYQNSAT